MLNTLFTLRRTITFLIKQKVKHLRQKTLRVCISMLRNHQISVEGKRKEREKLLAMSENKLHHQM